MNNKRMMLGMLLALGLMLGFEAWQSYEKRLHPDWGPQPPTTQPATNPSKESSKESAKEPGKEPSAEPRKEPSKEPGKEPGKEPEKQPGSESTLERPALSVVGSGQPQSITLGSIEFDSNWDPKTQKPYPLAIQIESRGAGIASATLNHFHPSARADKEAQPKEVLAKQVYQFEKPYASGGAMAAALATRCVWIDGASCDLWNVNWQLSSDPKSKSSAVWFVEIADAHGHKLLKIEKRFELHDATQEDVRKAGMGYEFDVSYALTNESDRALEIKLAFNGTNTPETDPENTRDLAELFTGYSEYPAIVTPNPQAILSIKESARDNTSIDLRESKGHPMLWTAQRSNYFAAIVRPNTGEVPNGPVPSSALTYAKVFAQSQAPDANNTKDDPENKDDPVNKEVAIGFETIAMPLAAPPTTQPASATQPAAVTSANLDLKVYFGPTARKILDEDYYTKYPLGYDAILVVPGGCCGPCTFTWLINWLVDALNGFHFLFRDWGLAIIALVLVVRVLLHPITKKSQVSMTKMSKMAPEMERLKKKFGDDKEGLNKAMMGFYREQGITPILGCLPMFLQMPIWIALWSALQSTFEIRQAPFLWGHTWISDLSLPDAAISFHGGLNLGFYTLKAINILPILMAVVFYFQQKMQPKPDPKTLTPEQAQQQKMMQWMSLLFPIFLYTSPSGLNLYILTSTAIGIYESKRIRDHIKERDEAEKEGRLPPDKGGIGGGIMGWIVGKFTDLQAKAEAARGTSGGHTPVKKRK